MRDIKDLKSNAQPEEEPLEGGLVTGVDDDLGYHPAKHHADTARRLTYSLVVVLAVSVGAHYALTFTLILLGKPEASEKLETIFNAWLPVVSGLVGAAASHYFTKERS